MLSDVMLADWEDTGKATHKHILWGPGRSAAAKAKAKAKEFSII